MVKCNVCLGIYEPMLSDGTQYFHACPPLSAAEIKDGLAKKTLTLTPAQQAAIDAAAKLDADPLAPKLEAPRADLAIASLIVERPGKRDENVLGAAAPGQPAPMKAPGAGVTKL